MKTFSESFLNAYNSTTNNDRHLKKKFVSLEHIEVFLCNFLETSETGHVENWLI